MTAENFKEKIEAEFESLYDFVDCLDYESGTEREKANKFLEENGLIFIEREVDDISDSYDFTDEILNYYFEHKESGKYFSIHGTNQSYSGTEINGVKEVKRTEKTITVWA